MSTVGRPTKYQDEFAKIAEGYLAKGKSITQLAKKLNVSKSTVYKWASENQVFSDALSIGREFSQAFWEDELESMMYSKDVNAPLVKLYFANRFGWTDKQEVKQDNTSSDGSMSPTGNTFDKDKYKQAQEELMGKLD